MPLLLQTKHDQKRRYADPLVRAVPRSPSELAAEALANLWKRLLQSYSRFSQPGCEPFVVGTALPNNVVESASSPDNLQWAAGFSTAATCNALIQHLFLCNERFDALSWVIAFCLIDRLQLRHYVRQRLQNLSFWVDTSASSSSFRLELERTPQLLFTVYCLAFKWHLDFTVSVKYLTNLLPHPSLVRKAVLKSTIADELLVLRLLEYDCAVTDRHVGQLMEYFLTAAERTCVLQSINQKTSATRTAD